MPIYMDIHRSVDGSIEEIQAAHMADLEAQEKHGVRYLKYWHNPEAGTICCLVQAPDPDAATAVHLDAHGDTAEKLIEVDEEIVEAFLGGSADAGYGRMVTGDGNPDGAVRTVLFTDLVGSTALTQRLGDEAAMRFLRTHDAIVRREIEGRSGRVVKHTGDGFMASFRNATSAVETAIAVLRVFSAHNASDPDTPIVIRMGMSSGEPVDEGSDLFGAAVQLARRVCDVAEPETIYVSNVVCELCVGKSFVFDTIGDRNLKGFSRPVLLHSVAWMP